MGNWLRWASDGVGQNILCVSIGKEAPERTTPMWYSFGPRCRPRVPSTGPVHDKTEQLTGAAIDEMAGSQAKQRALSGADRDQAITFLHIRTKYCLRFPPHSPQSLPLLGMHPGPSQRRARNVSPNECVGVRRRCYTPPPHLQRSSGTLQRPPATSSAFSHPLTSSAA